MFLFKKKPKTFLGVDIGVSAVKLIELIKKDERYELNNYAIYSLEKHLRENKYQVGLKSFLLPLEEVAQLIKDGLKQAEIKTQPAYFSIPTAFNFSTLANFPNMSAKELASAVPYEAQKYVPVPISEVVLDWSVVNRPKDKDSQDEIQVLLVAAPRKVLTDYRKIAQLTGLKIDSIEEESFSLVRSLVGNDKSRILLLDLGARSINVSIVDQGYIWFSHNLEIGGVDLTQKISEELGLDLNKAENLKKNFSNSQENIKIKGIINEVLGPSLSELKRIIQDHQKKYARNIERCILVGGGAKMNGLDDYLANKINLDVSVGDPFARVVYPDKLKSTIKKLGPSLAVAVGLAMR